MPTDGHCPVLARRAHSRELPLAPTPPALQRHAHMRTSRHAIRPWRCPCALPPKHTIRDATVRSTRSAADCYTCLGSSWRRGNRHPAASPRVPAACPSWSPRTSVPGKAVGGIRSSNNQGCSVTERFGRRFAPAWSASEAVVAEPVRRPSPFPDAPFLPPVVLVRIVPLLPFEHDPRMPDCAPRFGLPGDPLPPSLSTPARASGVPAPSPLVPVPETVARLFGASPRSHGSLPRSAPPGVPL